MSVTEAQKDAPPMETSSGGHFRQGIWRVADPKITLASLASMLLGAGAAAHDGPIHWGWLALTVVGIVSVEAAKNASGEIFDFYSGTDVSVNESERTPFSGGKRVIVDGLLTPRQTAVVAAGFYVAAIVVGLSIALEREPNVLFLGMIGLALAFFYHAPPLKLSYRGMGELAVALAYGPVIAAGTYLVQRHYVSSELLLASLALGLLIGAFLWINEFPDSRADALAGKRTLVVMLGRRRAARTFGWIFALAFGGELVLPFVGLPVAVLLGLVGVPFAVQATKIVLSHYDEPHKLVPAQAATLKAFLASAAGMAAGFVLSGLSG